MTPENRQNGYRQRSRFLLPLDEAEAKLKDPLIRNAFDAVDQARHKGLTPPKLDPFVDALIQVGDAGTHPVHFPKSRFVEFVKEHPKEITIFSSITVALAALTGGIIAIVRHRLKRR